MIIDGKAIAKEIEEELRRDLATIDGPPPCLVVVLVGEDPASSIYVNRKVKACTRVGVESIEKRLPASTTEEELLSQIEALNHDPTVHGILVQLPLPSQIDPVAVTEAIDPHKDVDGFHPLNAGRLLSGREDVLIPCTPLGIYRLLQHLEIPVEGKHAVIVGRSNIVGKPMASILMQRWKGANATVTVVHRHSQGLVDHCRRADILIAAAGKAGMITGDMIKEGAVVIDVGINRVDDPQAPRGYRIVGDVDFDSVKDRCSAITPVPGGVGPLTIAMLLQNTVTAFRQQRGAPFRDTP